MEDSGLVDQGLVHILPAQAGIGTGLSGEGEAAVAGSIESNESQGGKHRGVNENAPGLDTCVLHGAHQQMAEGIVADLAQEGGLLAVLGQGCQEIGGCAAGQSLHQRITVCICAAGGKVNEHFAQCYYINHGFSPYCHCLRWYITGDGFLFKLPTLLYHSSKGLSNRCA